MPTSETPPYPHDTERSAGDWAVDRMLVTDAEGPVAVTVRPVPPFAGIVDQTGCAQRSGHEAAVVRLHCRQVGRVAVATGGVGVVDVRAHGQFGTVHSAQ